MIHESDFWPGHYRKPRTPKPTVDVKWPTRRTRPKSTPKMPRLTSKPRTERPTTKGTITKSTTTKSTTTTTEATTTDPSQSNEDNSDVERIDVDICPDDEDQETAIEVPDSCANVSNETISSSDYMKVDLHPDFIEDGSPVWMVYSGGQKITSKIRADAGLVVGCKAYAGLDFSGNVVVRNRHDDDFIGIVFGYRSNSQFYLVSWKAKSDKYWIGWPSVVKADAGLHIKLVNSSTGPGAYMRNALYSTESVKDQVKLLWQDPNKQGWKHLLIYSWQLIHRPRIGLIRIKVFRLGNLIVDSGNVFDKTIKGGRIGVYAFSQETIEWHKMKYQCNDKIPKNIMAELPPDLQKISVVDNFYTWNNVSGPK
ncbi:thrombospondin-4-B-like [Cydia fagiglandana]|uniref:thrombospondin-4-B-like n=1 Tax=Cydia fagiglandana TaxID=1458189 RepID=UPI002FEE5D9A